ncbi:uncharacterized protein LOC106155682 [Lingula anatina]|uniref:Uncharacterized protein LOC106155682 n=1 Tax=Lingula anatina TaxID=7574 RepID=A0A1S3HKT4_LINAN|nr:uncharacterized protein LOC106155682 [Lingula anatina]|eukprot:XP_013386071.1 uncharacterized protein LOC106155682 [Lingula anatina]
MDPDREPTRCYNSARRFQENGSLFNEFICPEWDQPDELEYCCGPELQQYCCGFWDDGGRVAGVVIGILIAVTLVIGCIACCCCQARKRRASCKCKSRNETTGALV